MLKKSITQLGESEVGVGDDGRAEYDDRYKLAGSKISGDEVDSSEIRDDEIGKNQKMSKSTQ